MSCSTWYLASRRPLLRRVHRLCPLAPLRWARRGARTYSDSQGAVIGRWSMTAPKGGGVLILGKAPSGAAVGRRYTSSLTPPRQRVGGAIRTLILYFSLRRSKRILRRRMRRRALMRASSSAGLFFE